MTPERSLGRLRARARLFLVLVLATCALVIVYAVGIDASRGLDPFPSAIVRGAHRGLIIGVLFWGFELFVLDGPLRAPLRRAPFTVALLASTLASGAVLALALVISRMLVSARGHGLDVWLRVGFPRDAGFALAAAFAFHFVLQVRRAIGGRVLTGLLLGQYHRPERENRIFLFLDLVGSTSLAQKLGDVGVHSLITRFFFDIAGPVQAFGGETHRYIGDQVVVFWPLDAGVRDARCLRCCFAIRDEMHRLADGYRREFGVVPQFGVGLHGGPVVAGRCGDDKQEIVYFGDTINTAARLEPLCRKHDVWLIVSGELLARITLPPAYVARSLGATTLAGREAETEIFTIDERD